MKPKTHYCLHFLCKWGFFLQISLFPCRSLRCCTTTPATTASATGASSCCRTPASCWASASCCSLLCLNTGSSWTWETEGAPVCVCMHSSVCVWCVSSLKGLRGEEVGQLMEACYMWGPEAAAWSQLEKFRLEKVLVERFRLLQIEKLLQIYIFYFYFSWRFQFRGAVVEDHFRIHSSWHKNEVFSSRNEDFWMFFFFLFQKGGFPIFPCCLNAWTT